MTNGEILEKGKKKKPAKVVTDDRKTPLHAASEAVIETERGELSAARRRREAREEEVRRADCAKRDFDRNVGGGVDRDKLPDSDFAGRNRSFPIVNQSDVSDALESIGRAGEDNYDAATLRRRIISIARRKGFSVPGDSEKAMRGQGSGGNPVRNPYQENRVSEPLTQGHQSYTSGDHGVGQGRNPGIAAHHPDLRQSNVDFSDVLARLHTVAGTDHPDADLVYTPGAVALHSFDAAAQAGSYRGMQPVNHSPERPDYHPARQSATKPNGSHSAEGGVVSTAVPGKNRSNLDIMKAHIREQIHRG